jgi:hypothetical protein
MVSSIHEEKVSDPESKSPAPSTTTDSGRTGKRKRGKEDGDGEYLHLIH